MVTLQEVWRQGTEFLRRAGVKTPALDAEVLLRHLTGQSREEFYRNLPLPWLPDSDPRWREMLNRRASGTPVAYITGEKEFYGLTFQVTPAVLVPRPETEILVQRALELFQEKRLPPNAWVLDIGTGSGAIAVTLAVNLPKIQVTATDISVDALSVARANARRHQVQSRLHFETGDLWPPEGSAPADGLKFNLVVSNPPYIEAEQIAQLSPEVRHEPTLALDGGPDGLSVYRRLISGLKKYMLPQGWVLLEVGADQADHVSELLAAAGFKVLPPVLDLAGYPRVVQAKEG